MSRQRGRSTYREDLDGLRAIAVLSVIFFHLGSSSIPGGFVGVDIFFVLSGFLITSQIASDTELNRFSLVNFYERRIRRIVPALIVVLAATTLFAGLLLLPEELMAYLQSLLAAAFSCSNILFFLQNDYFGPNTQTQLLLHTWSLGVEEQFYILYPLMLGALLKQGQRLTALLVWGIALASLVACIVVTPAHERAAFFLLPMRAWQLLSGAIIALNFVPRPEARWVRECAGVIGIASIGLALALVNSTLKYPGVYALAPTLGAALVIWSGAKQDTLVARVLKLPPLPFIGLISYSLYLWHWPLIVGAHLVAPSGLEVPSVVLLVATFSFAFLSWRYVERPFRKHQGNRISRAQIFTWNGLSLAVIGVIVALGIFGDGWPSRFSESTQRLAKAADDFSPQRKNCHFETTDKAPLDKSCILGNASDPAIIVYGDSHGIELSFALAKFSAEHHQSVREFTTSGCPAVLHFEARKTPKCQERNAAVTRLLASLAPTSMLLAVGWDYGMPYAREKYLQGLAEVLDRLHEAGHRLFLIGTTPMHQEAGSIPDVLARLNLFGINPASYHFSGDLQELKAEDSELIQFASAHHATYLPFYPLICGSSDCRAELEDKPVYFDSSHLSVAAAESYVRKVVGPALWP